MKTRQVLQLAIVSTLTPFLVACGGNTGTPTASSAATASVIGFVAMYNQALSAPQTTTAPVILDLFDDAFLDAGYTKAQVSDNLKQDADSLAANAAQLPADSVYPQLKIAGAAITQCDDATGICLLSSNYVNAGVDGSSVSATVPVRFKDGKFRLYGDQMATAI